MPNERLKSAKMNKKRCLAITVPLAFLSLVSTASAANEAPLLKLRAVPFTDVQITDSFWAPRRETNRVASIPANLRQIFETGAVRNFELAAQGATNGFSGRFPFMDSDVYKALEAAAYSLATHPDPALDRRLDEIIAKVAAAQQPDGYLNTFYTVKYPGRRWTNLRDSHELYCAGHLFEAAVAHCQATGKRNLLDIAVKYADHIDSVFGLPPKRMGYPGHPEIELALVKLWRATGERRYFELARFFVENRGKHFFADEHKTPPDRYDGTYWQDDVPIYDHRNIKGHAVRACYLLSGVTDVAAETGNSALLQMLGSVWRNTTERNLYLTGGIGSSAHNEGFTADYDLPNLTAYQETCATVALAQWNHRLALLYGDAKYADVVERALYNGVLAGVSQDGTKFFYVNPLESSGGHHRQPWFSCACCPPNVARTLASLGGYAYAMRDDGLWVNLYIQGAAKAEVAGQTVTLSVATDYPWDGAVILKPELAKPARFKLRLRIPGWCNPGSVSVKVNRKTYHNPVFDSGYVELNREWRKGDVVELNLPMSVQRIAANPNVAANQGLLAIQRGPMVYCVEQCDQSELLSSLALPADAELKAEKDTKLFGGVIVLKGFGEVAADLEWKRKLYQPASPTRRVPIKAIPYYAWDNRQAGALKVWMPVSPPAQLIRGPESAARVTVSFANDNAQPGGLNDGIEPKSSNDHPPALMHWWPHKGTDEWAQYTWKDPVTVNGAQVYWFDDTGGGECRLPVSWQIEYRDGDAWKPVPASGVYPIRKNRWCAVSFAPVTTTALRLNVKLQPNWAAGVHEWKVVEPDE